MVIRPGHSIARPWPRSGHNFRLDQNGWGVGSMGFGIGWTALLLPTPCLIRFSDVPYAPDLVAPNLRKYPTSPVDSRLIVTGILNL